MACCWGNPGVVAQSNPGVLLGQSRCGCPEQSRCGVGAIPAWLPWISGQTRRSAPTDGKINKKFTGGVFLTFTF
ncbi:MAG: hypothetical protein HC865_03515 [Cyanobacteria bacterium RU_5_0]|nr:hypothetical protein [Cyanobacteria bacterium RU_5_0]